MNYLNKIYQYQKTFTIKDIVLTGGHLTGSHRVLCSTRLTFPALLWGFGHRSLGICRLKHKYTKYKIYLNLNNTHPTKLKKKIIYMHNLIGTRKLIMY